MAAVPRSPIFVVGTQRSGTTLLCRMLSAHPNLFVINEIDDICEKCSLNKTPSEVFESIDLEFKRRTKFSIEAYLEAHGKIRWGLKSPSLTFCLDAIKKHFPESKFIFIVRDGRAVANSYLKAGWGVANMYGAGERWKKEIELQRVFWGKNPDISCMLKYEELLANPSKELTSLCSFIGESFEESMVKFYKEPSPIKKNAYNTNVFRPIDRSIEFKWKSELSPHQIGVFESIAGEQLKELGYQLVHEGMKIPKMLKLWWRWHQKVAGEMQVQYHWRIKPLLQKVLN
ncbi:MAG: sulfotransferase [Nitrospinae bacterium]|nr:sulfotransferase [Nitrospinota bacterium]